MALLDRSVRELLDAFSSSDPTPGGGSASALASAVGTALLIMVAKLPKTRSGSDDDTRALASAMPDLTLIYRELTEAVDLDAAAYDRVVAAYKEPKATPEEQQVRKAAIAGALRAATDVPLTVMRRSAEALELAQVVAAHGHRGAASDVGVALALLRAGLHGARLNVETNLTGTKDATYTQSVQADVEHYAGRAADAATIAEGSL